MIERLSHLVLVASLFASASFAAPSKNIKIGLAFRFEEASQDGFINSFSNGFELAKRDFQKRHPETKIEFVKYSHTSKPETMKAAAKKIIADGTQFVLGGEASDEVKVLGEEFDRAKVLLMSPTSSDPEVTTGKNFVFRACFSDDLVAKSLAQYVLKELKSKPSATTLGIVHNTGNGYTNFLTKTFFDELNRLMRASGKSANLKILKREYYGQNYNFDTIVKDFNAKHVEDIILFTGMEDFYHFVDSAQKQKFLPTYFGSDGWGTNQSIVESLGKRNLLKDFVGVHNSYWYEESPRPEVKAFITDYKQKFGHSPDGWAAIAFDAAKILLDAIAHAELRSQSINSASVAKILRSSEFTGLVTTPKLKYQMGNSPKKSLYLYEISANRPEFKAALE